MANHPSPLTAPTLRDDLPRYPPLVQLIRVTAGTVAGPTGISQVAGSSVLSPILYVSFTQQTRDDGSLLPRDREPCLAADRNGIGLLPGFYLGRLSGSWTSLPVYEVISANAIPSATITNLTVTGSLTLSGAINYTDTTAPLTSNINNYSVSSVANLVYVTGANAIDITGIVAPSPETARVLYFRNDKTENITFKYASTSSSAGNRFYTYSETDLIVAPGEIVQLIYDTVNNRWTVMTLGDALYETKKRITLLTGAAQGTPAAGSGVIYWKSSDKKLYGKNEDGTEYDLTSGAPASAMSWVLGDTLTHADLTDADTQQEVTAYTLAAKESLIGVQIITKTVGSGGGVLSLNMQTYINGSTIGNIGDGLTANDINGYATASALGKLVWSATGTMDVKVQFNSGGCNLVDLTGGEWEVWVLVGDLTV